jgi:hypothetical protein
VKDESAGDGCCFNNHTLRGRARTRMEGCLGYCASQRLWRPVLCARVSWGFESGVLKCPCLDYSKTQRHLSINRIGFDWVTVRFANLLTGLRNLIRIQLVSRHGLCPYQPAYPGKVVSVSGCGLRATKRDRTLPLGEGFFMSILFLNKCLQEAAHDRR